MKYNFELDEQHVNIIFEALSNGPWAKVNPVIVEMQRCIKAQQDKEPDNVVPIDSGHIGGGQS